jgi:hypothetical protein
LKFQWPVICALSWARATTTSNAARKHAAIGTAAFAVKLKTLAIVSHLPDRKSLSAGSSIPRAGGWLSHWRVVPAK